MTTSRMEQFAPLTGLGFTVLGLAATATAGRDPGFAPKADKVVAYFTDHKDAVLASRTMYLLSAVLLLWFISTLRSRLAAAEGGGGRLANVAFAGGVAGTALALASASAAAMGALRVGEQHIIDPQVATTLWDLNIILFSLAAPVAFAALALAASIVSIRTAVLPRWLGWITLALAITLMIPPINHISVIVFTFWVGLTGVVLTALPTAEPNLATRPVADAAVAIR